MKLEKNMILLISCLEKENSTNHLVINYNGIIPKDIFSFENALNPNYWVNHFQPFACVIKDEQQEAVVLVRDHLGIEPLYYHFSNRLLIVAQTISDILIHVSKRPGYNHKVLKKMPSGWMEYTDETHYAGIYRVEPGHMMHFKPDGTMQKKPFWTLKPEGPVLYYQDKRDYLAHFASLMDESLLNSIGSNASSCASEFSAGLDSSAIYSAARDLGISPSLFMNHAPHGTQYMEKYNSSYEQAFLQHYPEIRLTRVYDEDFDPIEVFKEYASWFSGPAPYLFFMFAQPLHRAVAESKHQILLSGFGGDQCISGQIPKNFYIPQLLNECQFQLAWHELFGSRINKSPMKAIKQCVRFTTMMHSWPYDLSISYKKMRARIRRKSPEVHPYYWRRYNSVREAEWFLLQGPDSTEVRMRIEYSSIIAKKMGFSYRYPLLYPNLLEFMMSLPLDQKRHNGQGRYLMKRYLEYKLGKPLFQAYRKSEGLAIIPSTLHRFKQIYDQGEYNQYFCNLPKLNYFKKMDSHFHMLYQIQRFMLHFAETSPHAVSI